MKAKCAKIAQDNDPIYISIKDNDPIYLSFYISIPIYLSIQDTDPIYGPRGVSCLPLVRSITFSIMLQQILIFKGHLPIMNVPNSNLFSKDTSYFYLEDSISTLTRSATACEGEQQNLATAFLDGSQIYGGV